MNEQDLIDELKTNNSEYTISRVLDDLHSTGIYRDDNLIITESGNDDFIIRMNNSNFVTFVIQGQPHEKKQLLETGQVSYSILPEMVRISDYIWTG